MDDVCKENVLSKGEKFRGDKLTSKWRWWLIFVYGIFLKRRLGVEIYLLRDVLSVGKWF